MLLWDKAYKELGGMASIELVRRLDVKAPARSLWDRAKQTLLSAGRPTIAGIDIHDLDYFRFAVPVSLFYFVGLVVCFVSILYAITTAQVNQAYLAVDNMNPNAICIEVPLAVTNQFEGSLRGFWSGSAGFNANESIWVLDMENTTITTSEFTQAMEGFQQQLQRLGSKMAKRPLVYTAMVLSSYFFCDDKSGMCIWSSASAGHIFDRQIQYSFFTNKDGACIGNGSSFISAAFNADESTLRVNLPVPVDPKYMNDLFTTEEESKRLSNLITCPAQLNTGKYLAMQTWKSNYRNGILPFEFDIRSIVLAASLNLGLISTKPYDVISLLTRVGLVGYADLKVDPPMSPVWCLDKNWSKWNLTRAQKDGPEVCYVQTKLDYVSHGLYYPMLFSSFYDTQSCMHDGPCRQVLKTCPVADYYDVFDVALIYANIAIPSKSDDDWNREADDDFWNMIRNSEADLTITSLGLKLQKFLLDDPKNGDIKLMEYLFPALATSISAVKDLPQSDVPLRSWTTTPNNSRSYMSHGFQNLSYAHGKSENEIIAEAWNEICADCAAIVVESFQYVSTIPRINEKDVTFFALANNDSYSIVDCMDLISQPSAMNKLVHTPPTKLVNSYYQCNRKPGAAFVSALGSALASSNAIMVAVWVIGGWVLMYLAQRQSSDLAKLPSKRFKQEVYEAFEETKNETMVKLLEGITASLDQMAGVNNAQRQRLKEDFTKFRRLCALQSSKTSQAELEDVLSGPDPLSLSLAAKVNLRRSHRFSHIAGQGGSIVGTNPNPMLQSLPQEVEMASLSRPSSPERRDSITLAVLSANEPPLWSSARLSSSDRNPP